MSYENDLLNEIKAKAKDLPQAIRLAHMAGIMYEQEQTKKEIKELIKQSESNSKEAFSDWNRLNMADSEIHILKRLLEVLS